LLGLTITVGALLLVVGCGGANSNSIAQSSLSRLEGWGQLPSAPQLYYPYDNMVVYWTASGKISFYLRAFDPEGNQVKFKIVVVQNGQETVFGPEFSGWSKQSYNSGEWARCDIPVSMLPKGTFQWYAFATDRGNPHWSESSNVRKLTNATR